MKKLKYVYPFLVFLAFSCGKKIETASTIATTIPPIQSMIDYLTKNYFNTFSLLDEATHIHTFSLAPSDIKNLDSADLYFAIGSSFEMNFKEALVNQFREDSYIELRLDPAPHTDSHSDEGQHGHLDSHYWLNLVATKVVVNDIARELEMHLPQLVTSVNEQNELREIITQQEKQLQAKIDSVIAKHPSSLETRLFFFHNGLKPLADNVNAEYVALEEHEGSISLQDLNAFIDELKKSERQYFWIQPWEESPNTKEIEKLSGKKAKLLVSNQYDWLEMIDTFLTEIESNV